MQTSKKQIQNLFYKHANRLYNEVEEPIQALDRHDILEFCKEYLKLIAASQGKELNESTIYRFKVKDYTTILIGQYDETEQCFYVQRGDGEKYKYFYDPASNRIEWYEALSSIEEKQVSAPLKELTEIINNTGHLIEMAHIVFNNMPPDYARLLGLQILRDHYEIGDTQQNINVRDFNEIQQITCLTHLNIAAFLQSKGYKLPISIISEELEETKRLLTFWNKYATKSDGIISKKCIELHKENLKLESQVFELTATLNQNIKNLGEMTSWAVTQNLDVSSLFGALEGLHEYTKGHKDLKGYAKFQQLTKKAEEAVQYHLDKNLQKELQTDLQKEMGLIPVLRNFIRAYQLSSAWEKYLENPIDIDYTYNELKDQVSALRRKEYPNEQAISMWLSLQDFQKEEGEQEYMMYFDTDIPKIILSAFKHFNLPKSIEEKGKFTPRKFEAIVDEFGLDDGGVASFTFEVQSLKKGKIYLEANPEYLSPPNNTDIVIDDNSCWHTIGQGDFYTKFREVK